MNFKYIMSSDMIDCEMNIECEMLTEDQILVVKSWLQEDVISPEDVVKEISDVLNSEGVFIPRCIGGNAFWREIGKEYTLITFQYEDCYSEGKCPFKPCKVPTELLYEIVKVWAVEYKKWREERAEFMKKNPDYKPKILGSFKDLFPWKK